MILPNWFLAAGDDFGAYFLPGLLIGPSIGLALAQLPLDPPVEHEGEQGDNRLNRFLGRIQPYIAHILGTALVGFLTFAVTRIWEATSLNVFGNQLYEAFFWGLGGAIYALSLGVSWLAWPLTGIARFMGEKEG
jgi:hypothetical protein